VLNQTVSVKKLYRRHSQLNIITVIKDDYIIYDPSHSNCKIMECWWLTRVSFFYLFFFYFIVF